MEILKNLINFVGIEIRSQYLVPVFVYSWLNYVRMQLPSAQSPSALKLFILESAIAEVLKNKINFEVTENWYPRRWLKPKQS